MVFTFQLMPLPEMPQGLWPAAPPCFLPTKGLLIDSFLHRLGQCKTFTIKTNQNSEQPGAPTSPSPRGSPRTWLCGSGVGPELVTGSPAGTEGGFWACRLSGACGRCKNPREAGSEPLQAARTDPRATKLSLAARRAPARLPSNR